MCVSVRLRWGDAPDYIYTRYVCTVRLRATSVPHLRSGTSRFGFLNNAVSNNMLHKAAGVALNQHEEGFGESGNGGTGYCDDLLMVWKTSLPTRRSARLKRTLQDEESANVKRQKP